MAKGTAGMRTQSLVPRRISRRLPQNCLKIPTQALSWLDFFSKKEVDKTICGVGSLLVLISLIIRSPFSISQFSSSTEPMFFVSLNLISPTKFLVPLVLFFRQQHNYYYNWDQSFSVEKPSELFVCLHVSEDSVIFIINGRRKGQDWVDEGSFLEFASNFCFFILHGLHVARKDFLGAQTKNTWQEFSRHWSIRCDVEAV